jgi:hypothetical protein
MMEPSKAYVKQYAGIGIATDYADASTFSADWMMWAVPVAGKDIRRWLFLFIESTAVTFDRTKDDHDILCVSTAGRVHAPVDWMITEAGKAVVVDTTAYQCWRVT